MSRAAEPLDTIATSPAASTTATAAPPIVVPGPVPSASAATAANAANSAPIPEPPPVIVIPDATTADPGATPKIIAAPVLTPLISSRPTYTLKDCVDIAIRQNSTLLQAKKKIEAAVGSIIQARAAFFPQLGYSGTYQYQENHWATIGINNGSVAATSWSNGFTITESLFSAGANTNRLGIARLSHSNQLLAYQAAIDDTLLSIRLAYYQLLLDQSSVEVHRQAIGLLDKQLKNEQNRFDAGLNSKSNVLRAQVTRANELPALLNAENAVRSDYIALSQLLNIPFRPDVDEAPFGVTGSLGFEPRTYSLKDTVAKALATRPELKAAENEIEISQKQLIVDRANILPHLNAFGQYSLASTGDVDHPNNYHDGYTVGIAANWNIFDGLATFGKMKSTRALMEAAIASRDQTRLQIESEVRGALNGLETAANTVESQARNVLVARENYILANAQYDAGLSTQLDILQARLDLTTAQTTVFKARYDYLAATAKLQRSLSSQFEIVSDTLPPTAPATQEIPTLSAPAKTAAPSPTPSPPPLRTAPPAAKPTEGQPPLPQP
ncbi:TolC family protein [Verrucomicrobium sp. GAS474]|uniref:TolC family protein n=1 Tax=Verrucomicrobium sp. GAS474 TaxID=1882831 RepID=UPI00138FE91D|nr:TolC family protein [Verrucomicrobium sp. GAS474]